MRYKNSEKSALKRIEDGLCELIQKEDYNKLTCSDIINESKVSRSTFYLYFKNKDQVVTLLCDDIFNHVFDHHLSKEKHHDFSHDHENYIKMIDHSFYHFLEDKELILSILNSGASSIFLKQLRKRVRPLVSHLLKEGIIGNNDVPFDMKEHQYVNGYTSLLQYYLRHANDVKPEVISGYFIKMCR